MKLLIMYSVVESLFFVTQLPGLSLKCFFFFFFFF